MALPNSKRQDALEELIRRLEFIQIAKGYNTDAGLHIFKGEEIQFGEDDPAECLSISVGDDSATQAAGMIRAIVPVEVLAIVRIEGTVAPLLRVEHVIADIRVAVEGPSPVVDRMLVDNEVGPEPHGTTPKGLERGATRSLKREPGSEYVGASCEYRLTFEEAWGGEDDDDT